ARLTSHGGFAMIRRCPSSRGVRIAAGLVIVTLLGLTAAPAQTPAPPFVVKIQDDKPVVQEVTLPVEPLVRAQPQFVGAMSYGLNVDGKRLTFGGGSARTTVRIDGQIVGGGGQQQPLGPGPRGKPRHGVTSNFTHNNVHVTQVMEIVPGKPS